VMIGLVICVVWQVFSRYVLGAPSTMTDEIARFSMIWVGLLGAAYGVGAQSHLSIDLLTMNLKGKKKAIHVIFVNLCVLLFAGGVLIWGGGLLVSKVYATGQVSPAMQVPMAYVYGVLPLSGLIMSYYSLLFVIEGIMDFFTLPVLTNLNISGEKA
jgi:TRAP-type C4-dicarboxylate transport system permease small subunit